MQLVANWLLYLNTREHNLSYKEAHLEPVMT